MVDKDGSGEIPRDLRFWCMALAPWFLPRLYRCSLTSTTISSISILLKDIVAIGIVDILNTGGSLLFSPRGKFDSMFMAVKSWCDVFLAVLERTIQRRAIHRVSSGYDRRRQPGYPRPCD